MYAQPSFLKEANQDKRHYLQLQGFMSNTYLTEASNLLKKEAFILPQIELRIEDIKRLNMPSYLRLGNRLERFFSFMIQESDCYEILAENVQIIENKVTIGELDFLVKDLENNEIFHVELGGKLYLYDTAFEDELSRWIGPNRTDSLLKKIDKLNALQFPLLYWESTLIHLEKLGIETENISQKICFKVRLYVPHNLIDSEFSYVSRENIKGYYIHFDTFLEEQYADYQYFMPEKQDWIVDPKFGEVWFSHQEILPMVQKMLVHKQSPMVWIKDEDTYSSIFVVFW